MRGAWRRSLEREFQGILGELTVSSGSCRRPMEIGVKATEVLSMSVVNQSAPASVGNFTIRLR